MSKWGARDWLSRGENQSAALPDMKGQEPGRDLHSHRQMSGQWMLKTTQEERQKDSGKKQWSSPEREAKIITLS